MKAVIYCRYSSDQQRATSLEDQERNCRRRAEAEGWEVGAKFADAAVTGSDSSRPGYQQLLAAASRGEFAVLLIDDLSRLNRDSLEQERVIRRLEFQGVRIIAVSDGYDSESKARKVHRGFKGLMNEIFLDDLREKVHRGMEGQALKGRWCGGKPFGYRLRPILDRTRRDAYGQPERIGTVLEIDPEQGPLVHWIFERFVEGASCLAIATELNARGVPSPGSTWRRKVRRCSGWMASGVRVIVKNELYTGRVYWNKSQYLKHPDTGKDRRRARPKSEWSRHQDEALRIVSDEVFERAQARTRVCSSSDVRLKSGGVARYLLSGLLVCERCGAHYIMANPRGYACSGWRHGGACSNNVRIRRDAVEEKILGPIHSELLAPHRVARMAEEMQELYLEQLRQTAERAQKAPLELEQLRSRIERLRRRLHDGELGDLTADELEAAIARAEAKCRELEQQPAAKASARVFAFLPKAAELIRHQVAAGLDGNPREAMKARAFLRGLFVDGKVTLIPGEDGSLWAQYSLAPAMLLKAASGGSGGRGSPVCAVPPIPVRVRLK